MQLKVNNFRSFDNEEFDFSRINIFIGENSGGKSSLLKFLLALKQTIDSPNESNFKLRGDLTDLGNYKEVVRNKEENRKLEFGFSAKEEYIEYYVNFIEKYFQKRTNDDEIKIALKVLNLLEDEIKTSIYFTLNSTLNNHNTITTEISNNKIGTIILESERNESDNTLITKILYDLKIHTGCINDCIAYKEGFFTLLEWDLKKTIVEMNPEEGLEIYYKMLFLLYFQNFCLNYIELISFVNPIGTIPKRFYFQEDKKASYKLIDIEKIINILGDPSLSEKDLGKILEYLNNSIRKLGIADELNISKNEDTPVVSLNVKTKGFWSNITDVGYGV
ncbi:MAG: AAA family ATPase, partial [Bacteroidaceae bacterium]|nr:AAA family ATPase [Bacteroidaceae bacterium]